MCLHCILCEGRQEVRQKALRTAKSHAEGGHPGMLLFLRHTGKAFAGKDVFEGQHAGFHVLAIHLNRGRRAILHRM